MMKHKEELRDYMYFKSLKEPLPMDDTDTWLTSDPEEEVTDSELYSEWKTTEPIWASILKEHINDDEIPDEVFNTINLEEVCDIIVERDFYKRQCERLLKEQNKLTHVNLDISKDEEAMRANLEEALNVLKNNPINPINPSHYNDYKHQPIEVMKEWCDNLQGIQAVYTGNVIKYIARWYKKNGLEDLKKAARYLEWLIEDVERRGC